MNQWPYSSDHQTPRGKRIFSRSNCNHYGSLNLFSASSNPPANQVDAPPAKQGEDTTKRGRSSPSTSPDHPKRIHYLNAESTATREFPSRGIRIVPQTPRTESPHGRKLFHDTPSARQNVQVVSIKSAYLDPNQMPAPRRSHSASSSNRSTSDMRDIMEYKGTQQQMRGQSLHVPVGVSLSEEQRHLPVRFSNLEKFCQAVRDHCQMRSKGITQFYVSLCRNMVGSARVQSSTPSTPLHSRSPSVSSDCAHSRILSLGACRDQLVALTSITVSLHDMASLLWADSQGAVNGLPLSSLSEEELGEWAVTQKDFASTFAEYADSRRMAALKIV